MPCYYTGTAEGNARLALDEARQQVTNLTSMLCMQLEALEKTKHPELIHGSVRPWWEHHKKVDQQRKENEKLARANAKLADQAKKKLTKEEKKALGLK